MKFVYFIIFLCDKIKLLKIMYEYLEIITDPASGEIISEKKKIFRKVTPREFMQVYVDDLSGMMNITTGTESKVLTLFWKFSSYPDETSDKNYVRINSFLFENIERETGLKPSCARNVISRLTKKNLLIRDEKRRGIYYLNPKYFWKGKISDNTRNLSLNINYDIIPEEGKNFDNQ